MSLMLHCGSVEVSEEAVRAVPAPPSTESFTPVSHGLFLDLVYQEINSMGLKITAQSFGLWNGGTRFFGVLELVNGVSHDDYGLVMGLTNSLDMSVALKLGLGSHCFCCDNLAFNSEVVLKLRHCKYIMNRIQPMINTGIAKLVEERHFQDLRIENYKQYELDDLQAHDLMIRAIKNKVIPPSLIGHVIEEYYNPSFQEFKPRNVWSLFNSFTHILKRSNPMDLPKRSMILHGLCDGVSKLTLSKINH